MGEPEKIAVDRRKILKVTGAAGIAGVGTTKNVSGETPETKETATFIEMNVTFKIDSPSVSSSDHHTAVEFYSIEQGELLFAAVEESDLKIFAENKSVVRFNGYHNIPTDFSSREYETLVTDPNVRLTNRRGLPLAGSVSVPAIQTKMENNTLLVKTGQKEMELQPGDSESLNLNSVEAELRGGETVEATPVIVANNHGELDVVGDKIVRGGA